MESGQRHGEIIAKTVNMEKANPVSTPGEDPKAWFDKGEKKELDPAASREYMAFAARADHVSQGRRDIHYSVEKICRGIVRPTIGDRREIKQLAMYLLGRPRVVTQ